MFDNTHQLPIVKSADWQAWKTIGGKTTKRYIGAASKLTKEKLDRAGEWFYEQVKFERGRETKVAPT